jgi:nucleotide-binding universal stress UspA family protein
MEQKILLPLDGSKVGEAALSPVKDLVSKLLPGSKVEITVLQVVSSLPYYVVAGEAGLQVPYTEAELEQSRRKALDYLEVTSEILRSTGATVEVKVGIGNPADEILRVADEINANLIAMSTHGRSGITRWAFGSITDRVLRGAITPILLVRAPREPQKADVVI